MRWDFLLQAGSERSPNGKKKIGFTVRSMRRKRKWSMFKSSFKSLFFNVLLLRVEETLSVLYTSFLFSHIFYTVQCCLCSEIRVSQTLNSFAVTGANELSLMQTSKV